MTLIMIVSKVRRVFASIARQKDVVFLLQSRIQNVSLLVQSEGFKMKVLMMLVFVISAFSGQVYAATVECTLITPKWLGLGRLSKTLEEQQLVGFANYQDEYYKRNQVRKMMRKAIINNPNIGKRAVERLFY